MRRTRGEQRFAAVTYGRLAEWTGLSLATIRSYGARGMIPRNDLPATMRWVNERRRRRGLSLIGTPDELLDVEPHELPDPPPNSSGGGYNPLTGDYDAT